MKQAAKLGFTLIELVVVIAILAIISTIAVGKFTDIRIDSARKANVANIKEITRAINTEIARIDSTTFEGMFNYAEALIDVDGRKVPTGSEGSYEWALAGGWYDSEGGRIPGIYCGIKRTEIVENANGQTTGEIANLYEEHEKNVGLENFAGKLGMYFLKEKEVGELKKAGVSIVSYHNYSNAQAKNLGWNSSEWYTKYALKSTGGGPGHRPDLSACFPAVLTNGMAVAVINPSLCETIYRDLGCEYASTNNVTGLDPNQPETYFAKGICKRLVVVGLGRDTEATAKFFESHPRCMTLKKSHYRNYLIVIEIANGQGNQGSKAKFVGVIDPEGKTAKSAQYDADWAS
jgi:prepilin-type N-terminal cleavage/methylation domain-containing protein